jgi:transcriptional regulator with XRE-family HTH domain
MGWVLRGAFDKLNDTFSMVDDRTAPVVQDTLAANLRRLRIARHLSLSELARATSISKATLSSIENARANPTIDTLAALAHALRVTLGELLEELPPGDIRVVRASAGQTDQRGGIARRRLEAIALDGSVEIEEISLPARQLREVPSRPKGSRAHVYVLQGKLIAGPVERVTELGPGDYASFPADVAHVYETQRQPSVVLALSHLPG